MTKIKSTLHKNNLTFMVIFLSVILRVRNVLEKCYRENSNTHFMLSNGFSKVLSFLRKCRRILYSQTSHRWQYRACVLHAIYQSLHTHTLRICKTYCFSTATMIERKSINVTLYISCLYYWWNISKHSVQNYGWT